MRLQRSGSRFPLRYTSASGRSSTEWLKSSDTVDVVLEKLKITREEAQAIVDAIAASECIALH